MDPPYDVKITDNSGRPEGCPYVCKVPPGAIGGAIIRAESRLCVPVK
jgi:hypothetical protein